MALLPWKLCPTLLHRQRMLRFHARKTKPVQCSRQIACLCSSAIAMALVSLQLTQVGEGLSVAFSTALCAQ
jgi:hypothetical protein